MNETMKTKNVYRAILASMLILTIPLQANGAEKKEDSNSSVASTTKSVDDSSNQVDKEAGVVSEKSDQEQYKNKVTTKTQKKTTSQKLNTQAEDGVVEVSSTDELAKALQNQTIHTVKLKNDMNLERNRFPVNHSVVIDGQGHTIQYAGQTDGTIGIYFAVPNITIHYKNINFGYESELGKNSITNASNYYGIAYGSGTGIKLIVENINYFSDYGSQPFFVMGTNSGIEFRGKNLFKMGGGPKPLLDEEFAEANKLVFTEGSKTTVYDNNSTVRPFLNSGANEQIILEKQAELNVQTRHTLMASSPATIDLQEGAIFNLEFTDNSSAAFGKLFPAQPIANINVGKNAQLNMKLLHSTLVNKFTVNFDEGSISQFSVEKGPLFTGGVASDFNFNNSKEVTLSNKSNATNYSVIGLTNLSLNFSDNQPLYQGYRTFDNNNIVPIATQPEAGKWLLNAIGFSRTPNDFTTDQKNAMKSAETLRFIRNRPIDLSFDATTNVTQDAFTVDKYQAEKQKVKPIDFYWKSPVAGDGLVFKAFNQAGEEVAATTKVTTEGQADAQLQKIEVPIANMDYGENKLTIKAFDVLNDGSLVENAAPPLNLTINVEGYLYFDSVTPELLWTNLSIQDTKGIVNRDKGNDLELDVVDSRQGNNGFKVTANLVNQAPNTPFTFVWKQGEGFDIKELKNQMVFFDEETTPIDKYLYKAKWNNETGVLLKSDNYIKPGEYNNTAKIEWLLQDVPKAR